MSARLRIVGRLVVVTLLLPGAWGAVALIGAPAAQSPVTRRDNRPALSPAQAIERFVVEPGYRIDLVAAEPLVQDPVAIAFDERGGLFVAENQGYPDPLEGEPAGPPQGIVARLTDADGDGRYDTRAVFAAGLTYPNGLAVWDGGVFVTVAPDLLYLKDTDGDGVADLRRVALTGFNATRTAQIRFSHPTLGPDGWIYLTSGLNGGRVHAPAHPERPAVEFTSSDSRYDPRTGAFELVGGQGQYGLTFDDHGRRFICANRHPVWHVVLEPWQLQRNPALAFSDTVQEVSAVGAEAAVWPLTRDLTTASFHPTLMATPHAGTFTSASGVHIHRGDRLPAGHEGSIFIAESAQNLVQRQVRQAAGVSFRSEPARRGVEFLASSDSWFRPVFLSNGPDGALYVVDMYRKDIDHPAYVPEESRGQFDFVAGRGMGRIYRLAAAGQAPGGPPPDLSQTPAMALVSLLGHRNGWWRDTAQRLLLERRAVAAVPDLRRLATTGKPLARLHALWTLEALGAATAADLQRALQDTDPAVREHGLRLAERRLPADPSLLAAVLPLADDVDPRVRLHAALALSASTAESAVPALAALAARDGADRWVRAAVLSGLHGRTAAFLDAFETTQAGLSARAAVMQDVARLIAATGSPAACVALIARLADPRRELQWQPAALSGVADGLRARGLGTASRSALMALVSSSEPDAALARQRLEVQLTRAIALARLEEAPAAHRVPAVELLGHADWELAGSTLLALLAPRQPAAVQLAAVRALGQVRDPRATRGLLAAERWRGYTPRVRDAALTLVLADPRATTVLLDEIEAGAFRAADLGGARARRLTEHRDERLRERARRLLGELDAATGRQAYERLRGAVQAAAGDAARGAAHFATHCAACHSFAGKGGRVGPDLSGIRNQPAEALLLHVLVPDHEITPGYEAYTVETRDGKSLFGRLESETAGSVTVRDGAGGAHVILRANLTAVTASSGSLMPTTFHEVLPAQALADLIAYLKQP